MSVTRLFGLLASAGVTAVMAIAFIGAPASAATPPDSCFGFNAGTGTITGYFDHEGDNAANPARTRDVDIPATIGGVSVTSIGEMAFAYSLLTSATLTEGGGRDWRDGVHWQSVSQRHYAEQPRIYWRGGICTSESMG